MARSSPSDFRTVEGVQPGTTGGSRRTALLAASGSALAAFVVLTLVIASRPTQPLANDLRLEAFAAAHRTPHLTTIAQTLTWFGSGPVLVVVGCLGAVLIWLRHRRGVVPLLVMLTLAATAGLVILLKIAVHRERPNAVGLVGSPALDYSFPSGHTTDSAVAYVLLGAVLGLTLTHGRRLLLAATITLAVLIGFSRIYLGYHYLTDVVGGWLLATAIITASLALIRTLRTGPIESSRPPNSAEEKDPVPPSRPLHGQPVDLGERLVRPR